MKELTVNRRYLAFAGAFYLLWWFAVEMILPQAFNPFMSRLLVVSSIFAFLGLSYLSSWAQRHSSKLLIVSLWLITSHYYYLFLNNAGDINWVVGSYITVIAISFCFPTTVTLISYSVFVTLLSIGMVVLLPDLQKSVFLPGIFTILIQANVGLYSRLKVIKNLVASNERFRLLFNSTFEGVLVHEDKHIVDANESLVNMLGYSHKELLGKDVLEILHPDERARVMDKMKQDEVTLLETKCLSKSKHAIDVEIHAKNFIYNQQVARLVTVQDISDRKMAEKEKILALTMAENVRVRDEFISLASHELKTPLSSLKLQTQMLDRDLRRENPKVFSPTQLSGFISLFNRQINRITELVESMLDVSRISTGRFLLDCHEFDFAELVKDVAHSLQVLNFKTGELFEIETPKQLMVVADSNRIKQVIENLLTNAVKYGNGERVSIKVLKESSSRASLIVQDRGIGISEEFLSKIFERFERAVSGQNISGLGLGLYIVKQIVEAHHGSISVESKLGKGSTFTVSLPLKS